MIGAVRHAVRYNKALRESVAAGGATWTNKTPLDVTGFEVVMDHNHVTHARRRHGNPDSERHRGQRPIGEEDLALVPRITGDPDLIKAGKPGRRGPSAARVTKVVGAHRYEVIVEARAKERQVSFVTMMKWST